MKKDSNSSQSRRRIIKKASESFRDLAILAKQLPEEDFQKIFEEKNILTFLKSLFYDSERLKENNLSADTELASLIASKSIKICRDEYMSINKYRPNSIQPTLDYLNRTMAICEEIGYEIKSEKFEKDSLKEQQKYICRIEEIQNKDKNRFLDFAMDELKINFSDLYLHLETRHRDKNIVDIEFCFSFGGGGDVLGTIILNIDFNNNDCKFYYISNVDESEHRVFKLLVKPFGKNHLLLKKDKIH